MTEPIYKLTEFSSGAGCGCKISPQNLKEILENNVPLLQFENLLLGNESNDDAAVYEIGNNQVLISTTDFFTPIVDDAFTYGKVAAANALSDVYAMGANPIMALAILAWPINKLPNSLAQKVLQGAREICNKAQIPLAGGHSIESKEPIFGLVVNGLANKNEFKKNNTAQEGDLIFLTKPIGTGILSTAMKRSLLQAEDEKIFTEQIIQLNVFGKQLGKLNYVTAMTDVTGFGLLGHLIEMTTGNNLCSEINFDLIPKISCIDFYLEQNTLPDATFRNWNAYNKLIEISPEVDATKAFQLLPDPQTNGGLLIAVNKNYHLEFVELMKQNGMEKFTQPIGKFVTKHEKQIKFVN